jgi:hypothetical protein
MWSWASAGGLSQTRSDASSALLSEYAKKQRTSESTEIVTLSSRRNARALVVQLGAVVEASGYN